MIPRPYQQSAHDAVITEIKNSIDPCLIDAAPAAGKSFIIAMLAETIHKMSGGKKILCLAPSAELVLQNSEKFAMTGQPFSMFSASAGRKDLRHKVVFGTPGTVKNRISRFQDGYGAVIIDECHGTTPTIRGIIDSMREGNPNLRVVGLSGTPYRLGDGYIFKIQPNGKVNDAGVCRNPYFTKCVIQVSGQEMLSQGYITPMDIGAADQSYDTSALVSKGGRFTDESLYQTFEGQSRLTSNIVSSVVDVARNMYGGCMIFAATIQHAMEIMESLPPSNSGFVTGNESSAMGGALTGRKAVIASYRAQKFKFLVSVGALTTGFDVEHTSLIATLRRSESVALIQQILGRAWRLDSQKLRSLWLDFADNIKTHFPDGDLFSPVVKAGLGTEGTGMAAVCPECAYENTFSANVKQLDYERDEAGYCLDLDGQQVQTDFGPLSAHHGRRCCGMVQVGRKGQYDRCGYRWTFKECPQCDAPNDIAARYCIECKGEIVDPNTRLRDEFARIKRTPTEKQTDDILSLDVREGVSQRGNPTVRADFVTPWRSFSVWFSPNSNYPRQQADWATFQRATADGTPRTVTYKKDAQTKFYSIFGYNKEADRDEAI